MDIMLTPTEIKQFEEALLSAFSRGDLQQGVFFGLGIDLATIVPQGNFATEVHELVLYVSKQNKVAALLTAGRDHNPGNPTLRKFDKYI